MEISPPDKDLEIKNTHEDINAVGIDSMDDGIVKDSDYDKV